MENVAIHVAGPYFLDCEGIVWKWTKFSDPYKFHDNILPKIRTMKTDSISTYFVGIDGSLWRNISNEKIYLLSKSHDVIDVFLPKCNIREKFIDLLCKNGRIVRVSFSKDIKQIFNEICPFSNVQSIMYYSEKKIIDAGFYRPNYTIIDDRIPSVFYLLSDNSIISNLNFSTRFDVALKNVEKMENGWILTSDGKLLSLLSLDDNWNWRLLPATRKVKHIEIIDFTAFLPENVIFTDYTALYFLHGNNEHAIILDNSGKIPFNRGQRKKSAYK